MRRSLLAVLLFALADCSSATTGTPDGATPNDATSHAPSDVVSPSPSDVATQPPMDVPSSPDVIAPNEPAFCAGTRCAEGEACCLGTAQCYNPATAPDACPRPTTNPPSHDPNPRPVCSSNAHCAPDEYCEAAIGSGCVGPGYCQARNNCGSGPGGCGCDGVMYPTWQAMCGSGVRLAALACGDGMVPPPNPDGGRIPEVGCARDAQCGPGWTCCALSSTCVPAGMPERCEWPSAEMRCTTDADCFMSDYCDGDGCGTPGVCRPVHGEDCTGELDAVCGCNGRTYLNACYARLARVRVASSGACRDE